MLLLFSGISAYKQRCLLDLVTRFVFMWNKIFAAKTRAVHSPIVLIDLVKLYIIFSTRYTYTRLLHRFGYNLYTALTTLNQSSCIKSQYFLLALSPSVLIIAVVL